ncbi:MAG TPA: CBS domain-containing protein [Blastocatellia bacterium]|nr:CBS domain-containing protein [Blastocatellia bacterium]
MKVSDVMTREPRSCSRETNLASAVEILWMNDCGCLPVIDENCKVIGIVTDRDISIATATRDRKPSEITVGEVISGAVECCHPDDDVTAALQKMQAHRVRRIPVINREGVLEGILSLNDIALNAQESRSRLGLITYEDLGKTLKSICQPHGEAKVQKQEVRAYVGR